MGHQQIIKEHVDIRCRITVLNIQIPAGIYRQICHDDRCQRSVRTYLLETAAGLYKVELVIEQHPVEEGLRFRLDDIAMKKY
jgi:hypothetical protein